MEGAVGLFIQNEPTRWEFETYAIRSGFQCIAGVDEAGRGPLAGPVVAAAVILPIESGLEAVNDSKKLSAAERESLYGLILQRALSIGIGISDHLVIDRINILQATLSAMRVAVANLSIKPDYLLIDGNNGINLAIPQRTIKKGDGASISIAAASIVAKVTRDRLMMEFDCRYPQYGFAGHKGYGCASHLAAIAAHGPCDIHRKTFRGVREHVGEVL